MVYAQSQFNNELKYIPNRERAAFIAVDFPVSEGPTQTTTVQPAYTFVNFEFTNPGCRGLSTFLILVHEGYNRAVNFPNTVKKFAKSMLPFFCHIL